MARHLLVAADSRKPNLPHFHCWENEAVHSGVEQEEHLPRFHCLDNEAPHLAAAAVVAVDLTELRLQRLRCSGNEVVHSAVEEEQQQPNWEHFAAAFVVVVAVELLGNYVGEKLEQ